MTFRKATVNTKPVPGRRLSYKTILLSVQKTLWRHNTRRTCYCACAQQVGEGLCLTYLGQTPWKDKLGYHPNTNIFLKTKSRRRKRKKRKRRRLTILLIMLNKLGVSEVASNSLQDGITATQCSQVYGLFFRSKGNMLYMCL